MSARSYSTAVTNDNIQNESNAGCNEMNSSTLNNDEIIFQAMKNRARLLNLPSLHVVVMSG